ncbi:MAG: putative Ig domain-containing protein [Myxococcales bacterium]
MKKLFLAAALFAAPGAFGQEYPVVVSGGSYAPLGDAGSPVPGVTGTQNGAAVVSLNGWTFPYFDAGYGEITVTTDGYLLVGDGVQGGCTPDAGGDTLGCGDPFNFCFTGSCTGCCALGNNCSNLGSGFGECGGSCCITSGTAPPQNVSSTGAAVGPSTTALGTIAGWWETLDDTATSGISSAQGGSPGSHWLTVDYHGVPTENSGLGVNDYDFSITLTESGLIHVAYGSTTVTGSGPADPSGAWASLEDPAGVTWIPGLGCELDGGCTAANGGFPTNTDITYGSPPGVYLAPETVAARDGALDAGNLSFDVSGLAADLGQTPVDAGFPYNAYLVQGLVDAPQLPACPGGASCLGAFQIGSGIAAKSTVPFDTGILTVPYPLAGGTGTYYVEIWLDPANATGNTSEAVALSQPLVVGVDLEGSVDLGSDGGIAPSSGTFQLPITLENLGLLAANGVEYQLWLTATNTAISPTTDFEVEDATVTLGGGQTVNRSDTATTHGVPQGSYYVALSIDPNHQSGNLNPTGVFFSAAQIAVSPAHLVVTNVVAPASAFVGLPTHVGYTITNNGAEPADGFSVGLLVHPQSRGSAFTINDPQLLEIDGVSIGASCTLQAEDGTALSMNPPGCASLPATGADGGVLQSVVPATMYGRPTAAGEYLVGVIADLYLQVPGMTANANRIASPTPTLIQPPEPDFEVGPGDLTAPTAAAAGDQIYVDRQIHNVGIAAGATPYGYFLSAVGQINAGGIPVAVVTASGLTDRPVTPVLQQPGQGLSDDIGSDLLQLPTTLPPGNYTLSLIVDPDQVTAELSRTNDATAAPQPIAVAADGLQIVSQTLPTALVQVPYVFQLVAAGGLGTPGWSLFEGSLPAGLALSSSGIISGTPTATGSTTFGVQVSAGEQTQIALFAMTVTQATGPLQIVTAGGTELPPATVGRAYTMQLTAEGGVPPYRWSGSLQKIDPALALEPSGLIAGTPTTTTCTTPPQPTCSPRSFPVTVSDSAGNSATSSLSLEIVDVGTLIISTASLSPATVGQGYSAAIEATENDNQPHQFSWSIPTGEVLPPGLQTAQAGSTGSAVIFELQGTPAQAGAWPFRVKVTDELSHEASRQFILQVQPQLLALPAQSLPAATAGQAYHATLQTSGNEAVTFSLYSGDLPPGLALASDGSIGGTVSASADARQYAFAVLAADAQGQQAIAPLSIQVQPGAPAGASGCSTGAGESSLLLAALGLLLLRRRARGGAGALAVLAAAWFPAAGARAWSYTVSQSTASWSDITAQAGAVSVTTSETAPNQYLESLPFQFPFDSASHGQMTIWTNGAISFDSGSRVEVQDACGGFPYSGGTCPPPTTILAPWWGDLAVCYNQASVKYLVSGATGSRTLTVQWTNLNTDDGCSGFSGSQASDSFFSFQIVLHEGSGNIDFVYGPSTQGSAPFCDLTSTFTCVFAAGLEDGPAGSAALACNANCSSTGFPAQGTELTFSQHPDLEITAVQTPASAVQGGPLTVTVQLDNAGGIAASGASGNLFYSTDGVSFDAASPLTAFGPFNLAGVTSSSITRQVTVPAAAPLGAGWIIATVQDPGDAATGGKQVASASFDVFTAEPDLAAVSLTAPSSGSPGAAISLGLSVRNVGAAPATAVPYSYYLSSSATVSPNDLQIGGGTIPSLAAGATYQHTDSVTLPSSVAPGSYTVGVIVNPGGTVPEYTLSDNSAVAQPPLQLSDGTLAVSTTQLPQAAVAAPYQAVLEAAGGSGSYAWTLKTGSLPAGLTLAAGGALEGTPSAAGSSAFTVQVADGAGHTATGQLTLAVSAQPLPLTVLTNSLPGGSFEVAYQVELAAVGGTPPYQWSVAPGSGTPPPGIGVSIDGTVEGSPASDGAFVFSVQVTDAAGKTAQSQPLDLQVLSPGSVAVADAQLPIATEGTSYQAQLLATGGTPPYQWSLLDDQSLPSGPGASSTDLQASMPSGLSLDPSGALSGTATVAGVFALTVQVRDSADGGANTASDTVELQIAPNNALAILNPTVPDATVGQPYQVKFFTNAKTQTVTFTAVDGLGNPVGVGDPTNQASQPLPPGLTLDSDGQLSGTPASSAAGSTSKTYDFLVRADDGAGRIALAAVALTVDPPAAGGGGCGSATGVDGSLLAMGLALMALRRRRS